MVFDEDKGGGENCQLFGDFGVMVQMILGGISFTILIVKRIMESPKRSWTIWALDSSKQAFSALLAHFLNVLLAIFLSLNNANDACTWYLITVVFDCSIGICICVLTQKQIERVGLKLGFKSLRTGHYFTEGKENNSDHVNYMIWTIQFIIWCCVVCFSKLILFGFQMGTAEYLEKGGSWLLSGIEDPDLELVVVMIFIPLFMNMINFWVVDNYIKEKDPDIKSLDKTTIPKAIISKHMSMVVQPNAVKLWQGKRRVGTGRNLESIAEDFDEEGEPQGTQSDIGGERPNPFDLEDD